MTTVAARHTTTLRKMALPRHSSASLSLPAPILMAARALPPAPNHMENAFMRVMMGKATVVTATASEPTPCPRKMVLMMLYRVVHMAARMVGGANSSRSLPMGSVPMRMFLREEPSGFSVFAAPVVSPLVGFLPMEPAGDIVDVVSRTSSAPSLISLIALSSVAFAISRHRFCRMPGCVPLAAQTSCLSCREVRRCRLGACVT